MSDYDPAKIRVPAGTGPWRAPSDTEVAEAARTLRTAWPVLAAHDRGAMTIGAIAQRFADLSRNYGCEINAWREDPCKRWSAMLQCPCGDEHRLHITDENLRRDDWEPALGQLADLTYPVREHAETCSRALRRPGRPAVESVQTAEEPAESARPFSITPDAGASLWFVTDGSDGVQRAVRLDRRTDAQYPCIGRDAAIVRGLLRYALDLLDDPTVPLMVGRGPRA